MFFGGSDSPKSRKEKAMPDEIDKKIATTSIPQKFRADIERLKEVYKTEFMAGFSINWTLKQALDILPRERKRVDSYDSLTKYLKQNLGIELTITSNKSKNNE